MAPPDDDGTFLKRLGRKALTLSMVRRALRPLMRGSACILMLHRLGSWGVPGAPGHDRAVLRSLLSTLRREGQHVLSMRGLLDALEERQPLSGAVVFTIDDGYRDQVEVAGPVFAEFDYPVTVFVTTGFVDGKVWMWWDKVEYVFRHTTVEEINCVTDGLRVRYRPKRDWVPAVKDFVSRCKTLSDPAMRRAVEALAHAANVPIPDQPPPEYAPSTWEQLRKWEARGMELGPQTVTHPILARQDDGRAVAEIRDSWRRLREEVRNPCPVFCYPNGRQGDFGDREIAALRQLGFEGAVTAMAGLVDPAGSVNGNDRFRLPRLPYSDDMSFVLQYVGGGERLKQIVRTRVRSPGSNEAAG